MLINYITKEVEKLTKPFKLNKKDIVENIKFKLNILRNNVNALELNIANLKVKNRAQASEIAILQAQLKKSTQLKNIKNSSSKDKKAKVLIADDNKTNLHILEHILKKYNLEVISCNSGLDVLNSIENDTFDLIILDSIMPKLDGYRTVIEIRKNETNQNTPVILHKSLSSESENIDNIYNLGFNSYLSKPFDIADLELILKKYIPSINTSF